jgi:biotin synthase-related radical SAM superfamily protein
LPVEVFWKCLPRRLNLISFHLHEKRKPIISNSYKLLVRLMVTQRFHYLRVCLICSAVRRDRKGSGSTVLTTEIKQTYLYSNKLYSNQRDLASFKIICLSAVHYGASALTSLLNTVTQMMYFISSTNPINVHSYSRQIRISVTTINYKVFLTKLLESYSLFFNYSFIPSLFIYCFIIFY